MLLIRTWWCYRARPYCHSVPFTGQFLLCGCSIRYHLLHPDYLYYRIRELQKNFRLRVILCHIDVVSVSWLIYLLCHRMCILKHLNLRNLAIPLFIGRCSQASAWNYKNSTASWLHPPVRLEVLFCSFLICLDWVIFLFLFSVLYHVFLYQFYGMWI